MKIIKCIILSIFITFVAQSNIYAENAENTIYSENSSYNYEIIPVDVGNSNRRSGSSSRSHRTRRYDNKNNKKHTLLDNIISFVVMCFAFGIIMVLQNLFSKERRFLRHKKNIKDNISNVDYSFLETEFLNYAKELFINLNKAWTERDLSFIESIESKELFNKHSTQIKQYINNGTVNYIQDIQIKNIFISKFFYDDDYMTIVVKINTKLIDYIMNISNGNIIKGTKTKYWNMGYILTFRKEIKSNYNYKNWILYDFKGINL